MKRSAQVVLTNILVFCALAGGAELIARSLEGRSPPAARSAHPPALVAHPVLHHGFKPGDEGIDSSRAVPYAYRINSQGWREEADIPLDKPPGEFRVFFVGDSNTQGVVKDAANVVRRVEAALNERYRRNGWRIRAINTGTSSYSFLQYFLLVNRILPRYSPDLLIVNVDMTDLANDFFYRPFVVTDSQGVPAAIAPNPDVAKHYRLGPFGASGLDSGQDVFWTKFREVSAVARLISRWASARTGLGLPVLQKGDSPARWHEEPWSPETTAAAEYSMGILQRLLDSAAVQNIPVVVTLVPHYPQFTGSWSAQAHHLVGQRVSKTGMLFFDSYQALRGEISGSPPERYYWSNDFTHFNESGNEIWAKAMTQFLVRHETRLFKKFGRF